MRIIALDISLANTGVATQDPDGAYSIKPKPLRLRGPERLLYFENELLKLLRLGGAPAAAVIEDYPWGVRGKGARSVAELHGVIRLTLYKQSVPLVLVNPTKLKLLATGRGNAKKEVVLLAASRRLDYLGEDNNVADALWLLQFAQQHYDLPGRVDLPKTHLRALRGIEWPRR